MFALLVSAHTHTHLHSHGCVSDPPQNADSSSVKLTCTASMQDTRRASCAITTPPLTLSFVVCLSLPLPPSPLSMPGDIPLRGLTGDCDELCMGIALPQILDMRHVPKQVCRCINRQPGNNKRKQTLDHVSASPKIISSSSLQHRTHPPTHSYPPPTRTHTPTHLSFGARAGSVP